VHWRATPASPPFINVTDKTIYTEDGGGNVVQIGSGPSASDTLTNKSVSLTTNTVTGTKAEFDTACSDGNFVYTDAIGVSVQPYDADTAKTDVAQTFSAVQRTNETTDNDGSFDMNAALDFVCTPGAGFALTFTNIPATPLVQKGTIVLVNGSNYAITAHANTKVEATTLAKISATGTYELFYRSSNGVVYVTASGAMA
jgi:hypothetical protein